MKKLSILFICLGNICRSPMAQGVFSKLVKEQKLESRFFIDSAGIQDFHIGSSPDLRAQKVAKTRDIDVTQQIARQVKFDDFENFDYLLVMDDDNHHALLQCCPTKLQHKINYFLSFVPQLKTLKVPDPYYGGEQGFEEVLVLLEKASIGFLNYLKQKYKL